MRPIFFFRRRVRPRSLGLREAGEIESSIAAFASGSNSGLIVTGTSGAIAQRELIIKLAARQGSAFSVRLPGGAHT